MPMNLLIFTHTPTYCMCTHVGFFPWKVIENIWFTGMRKVIGIFCAVSDKTNKVCRTSAWRQTISQLLRKYPIYSRAKLWHHSNQISNAFLSTLICGLRMMLSSICMYLLAHSVVFKITAHCPVSKQLFPTLHSIQFNQNHKNVVVIVSHLKPLFKNHY